MYYVYVCGCRNTCLIYTCVYMGLFIYVYYVYIYTCVCVYTAMYVCEHMCLPVYWQQARAISNDKNTIRAGPCVENLTS